MLKSLLPNEVKINVRIDDNRLRINLTTKKTLRFTEKSFSYKILGFTQSHPGLLIDPPAGYFQKIAGVYNSEKPIHVTGMDNSYLKCDCNNASIVNGSKELILFSFALDKPPAVIFYRTRGYHLLANKQKFAIFGD